MSKAKVRLRKKQRAKQRKQRRMLRMMGVPIKKQ